MNTPIPENQLIDIKQALFEGEKIAAIKLYRKATDAGLAEAKKAVEELEAELRAASPEKFKTAASGKGCAGVLVMVCAFIVLLVLLVKVSVFF